MKNLLNVACTVCAWLSASRRKEKMLQNMTAARSALKLGFFISSLTVASLGARLATADISPDSGPRNLGFSAARISRGDLSDRTLHQLFDAQNSPLFSRHDPGLKQKASFDILQGYEGGAPLNHWDLTPQAAVAVNNAVPISIEPNPAAKAFVFKGGEADRQAAQTCLTQAIYYEAGFEPLAGAQAVAQVVLNRVRHPIFPKSVCGVVYQGSDLKTGCQFSFTCDGSLNRAPAPAAWARAQSVASKALAGFVLKDVGEATHYHTQWILPWWAPTVSKVAQVGTQIFYRWPGELGMPPAFNGRYAGNERVGKVDLTPSAAQDGHAAETGDDGRVHEMLAVSSEAMVVDAPPVTMAAAKPAAPAVEVATLKPDAPDLKVTTPHSGRLQSGFASPTLFNCTTGHCQHW